MSITANQLVSNYPALKKLNARLPDIVSMLLVIALGYTLARLGWQWFAPVEAPEPAATPVTVKPSGPAPQQKLNNITRALLFGKETGSEVKPVQAETPVSRLNVTLRGVLAADPVEFSVAIISAGSGKAGKEEIYGIGDSIQSGVKVTEIHPDHVIIERQGKYEKLVLVKDEGDTTSVVRGARATSSRASEPVSLGEIRREIMKNPTSFGEYALPVVVKQNGKQVGYRLKPQKKGELLSQYGLQASDIITEINGVSLDNPQNGIQALRELSSAQSVNLTVKRGNSFVPLNITLQ